MPTTFSYTRVSTRRQEEDGTSLKAMNERHVAYIDDKGLPPPLFFSDPAVSGKVPFAKREAGCEIIRRIRAGDHIVISTIDRGFRNVNDFLYWFEEWLKHDITLHVLNFGGNQIDPRTSIGRMVYRVLACVAELERDIRSDRASEVYAYRARHGLAYRENTRKPGFKTVAAKGGGYNFVPDPQQRELMGRMLQWHRAGRTRDWIRQHLEYALKVPPPGKATKWHPIVIVQFLRAEKELQRAEGKEQSA